MYKDLGNIEEKILRKIIQLGSKLGVTKVSSKRIAQELDIATGTIFSRFKTMQNAYDAAAQYFDRYYINKVSEMLNEHSTIEEVWDYFMEAQLSYPEGSLYYTNYTNTFGFDPTLNNPRSQEFLIIAKQFFQSNKDISDTKYLLMWDYLTSMSFYYSEKFIHYMPYNEENKKLVKEIVFKGLENIF